MPLSLGLSRRGLSRRCIMLGTLTAFPVLAAACGGQDAGTGESASVVREAVTTTFFYGGSAAEKSAFEAARVKFAERQPRVTVEFVSALGANNDAFMQKLYGLIAAGTAPDTTTLTSTFSAEFFSRGLAAPLDPLVKARKDVDLDDFFEPHLNAVRFERQLLGFPRDGAPNAMWLNLTALDAAGVPRPRPADSWSWEQLVDLGQRLTLRDGPDVRQYGTARSYWIMWVWQAGGDVLDKAFTKVTLDTPEAIAGLQFEADLLHKHRIAPPNQALNPKLALPQAQNELFLDGRLALFPEARWPLTTVMEQDKFRYDVIGMPHGKRPAVLTNFGPALLLKGAKQAAAGFEWLNYFCGKEGQVARFQASPFGFPSRKSVTMQPWFADAQWKGAAGNGPNVAFREPLVAGHGRTVPTARGWAEVSQAIEKELDQLWLGQASAEQAGRAATRAGNAALQAARQRTS